MSNGVKIEVSDTAVKLIVGGVCFLGFVYLISKLLDNGDDVAGLPPEAESYSNLPEVSPTTFEDVSFHQGVKEKAKAAFQSGDFCGAVRHAVIGLFDVIRRKSGVDGDATQLIQIVFRGKQPILKFRDVAPPHITNAEDGLVQLLEGFSKSVRKIHMHAEIEITPRQALQEINIACYLAERVEDHTVVIDQIDQVKNEGSV